MEEVLVQYKTAKLVKEVGFNIDCKVWYEGKPQKLNYTGKIFNPTHIITPAPTQSLLQKWLREVHNITFSVYPNQDKMWTCNITTIKKYKLIGTEYGKTYEEALELALLFSLNQLKPRKVTY